MEKTKINSHLTPQAKVDSRWLTDLGMNGQTIKSTEKMSEKICDVEAEGTLNKTSNTWSIRQQQQKNQLNYIRIGDFYSTKVTIDKVKRKIK